MAEYLSYKEAMKYLGFKARNYPALRRYIAAGLPVIDVNGSKRISKTAIDKFMAEHQSSTKD
ncbi:helix-turn-helix domain-containing protein [Limosilactobacillus mucosae]|uniref:helix-turn-helix domain-containing protein n=1 Tax=Limosilactobacillus mucosae TaxID=97478 RepID=UPI003CFC4497